GACARDPRPDAGHRPPAPGFLPPAVPVAMVGPMRRASPPLLLLATAALVGCAGELDVALPRPVAEAGFDQLRHLDQGQALLIELDGRASCDPFGDAVEALVWQVVQAPGDAQTEITRGEPLRAALAADRPGEYLLALTVHAGTRVSEPDYV